MKTMSCIPTLPDPAQCEAEFAQQLGDALGEVGAAYIPIGGVIAASDWVTTLQSFFALNEWQKRSFAQWLTSPWQGVYIALGDEQLADGQQDYKESLDINLEQGTYAQWINQRKARCSHPGLDHPEAFAVPLVPCCTDRLGMAESLCHIFEAFQECANQVLAAIEMLYQQPQSSLIRQHGKNSTLRLLHYPPAPHLACGSIRLGAHQDYSGITLLWQDSTGGLEILTPGGEWVAVDIPAGCIGVIVGEVMQRWSGGKLHGAPHRVRVMNAQQLQKSRYSIAFFCETNHDCVVRPGALLGHENQAAPPIVIKTFLNEKYDQIMAQVNF